MRMKRTERSTNLGANWRLARIQELHAQGKQPGRRMHIRNTSKGRRERAVLYLIEVGSKGECFAHNTSFSCFVSGCIFLPGRFRYLRFDDATNCINTRRHASSRQLYLLALSHSGRHILALLLCAGLIAPCCAVFAVNDRPHARTY